MVAIEGKSEKVLSLEPAWVKRGNDRLRVCEEQDRNKIELKERTTSWGLARERGREVSRGKLMTSIVGSRGIVVELALDPCHLTT